MPKELKGTSSPTNILTQEEYNNYVTQPYVGKPITQLMSDSFIEQYGADNWYDWTNNNWGCKWEVNNVEVNVEDETETQYDFQTAWCPPEGVYNALVKRFPDLYISWFYNEPSMQFAGYLPN